MMKLVSTGTVFLASTAGSAFAASPAACGTQFATYANAGAPSETFAASNGADYLDSYGAADFTVQTQCTLNEIDVKGQYFGPGPATSVDVIFYSNIPTVDLPSQAIKAYTGLRFSDPAGTGNFAIPIPSTTLYTGLYWVSVSANIDLATSGKWFWNLQGFQPGLPAVWRENGGWNTGCICWGNLAKYTGARGDYMFVLRGSGQ
jgi:hypothetical protein